MRAAIVVAVACLSAVGLCAEQDVKASIKKSTNIPAQELVSALKTLAHERGFQVVFRSEVVGAKRTHGAVGDLTTAEALTSLLEGTNLGYSYLDDETVTIVPVNANNKLHGQDPSAGNSTHCFRFSSAKLSSPTSLDQTASGSTAINWTASEAVAGCAGSYSEENKRLTSDIARADAEPVRKSDGESSLNRESTPVQLEEVVVTATKRDESIQRVPISISAYSQADLNAAGAHTLADIARLTPGVDFSQTGNFGVPSFNIAIRGISSATSASTTAIYLDDTPLSSRGDAMSFVGAPFPRAFDLDHVEVLRGPQGTLFGASAEGGAIRFITPTPDLGKYSSYVRAEVADTNGGAPSYEAGAAAGGPIVDDRFAFRISAWYRRDGGYINQVVPPLGAGAFTNAIVPGTGGQVVDTNVNYSDARVIRAALEVVASDWLTIEPAFFYQFSYSHSSNSFDLSLSDPSHGQFNSGFKANTPSGDMFILPSVKLNARLGNVDITSVTSYFYRAATASTDYTEYQTFAFFSNPWQLLPCLPEGPNCQPNENAHGFDTTHQNKWTEEVRLSSIDQNATISWVTGIYFEHAAQHDSQYAYNNDIAQLLNTYYGAPLATAVQDVLGAPLVDGIWLYTGHTYLVDQQAALFGEANFQLTQRLKLTGGIRVEHESNSFRQPLDGPFNGGPQNFQGAQSETPVTPKASLSWQHTVDNMLYATVAKGFRPGGANTQPSTTPTCVAALQSFGLSNGIPQTYKSDSLWSYELGAKTRFAEQRVQVDASIYHIDWRDIQTASVVNGCGFGATFNLGKATSNGFDLAVDTKITERLALGVAAGYVKATYDRTLGAGTSIIVSKGDWVGGTGPADGTLITPWTLRANGKYTFNVFDGHSGYVWIEDVFHSANPGPVSTQNPADTLNYNPLLTPNPSTNLLNARAGLVFGNLDVSLFANNVLNSHPELSLYHALSNNGKISDNRISAFTTRPLTVGFTATLKF